MDVLEQFLAATRSISAFNQIRTLFYRKPSIHRFCTAFFPSLTREMDGAGTLQLRCRDGEVQNKVRTRLKQSTNQIQIALLYFLLNLKQNRTFRLAKSVPLVYGVFTGSVPILYREGTEKLLRRYQRATKASSLAVDLQSERRPAWEHRCSCISQACVVHMLSNGQAWIVRKTVPVDTLSTHYPRSIYASSILDRCLKNVLIQISAFKRFNVFSQAYGWFFINNAPNLFKSILNRSLASSSDAVVQRTQSTIMKTGRAFSLRVLLFFNLLDCVLTELKSIRTYSLLVLMFSMFSLSAQTPRKDSGADGLSHLIALKPGDKIPDAVWNQTLELNYFDGKKKTIKFSDLKGKLIILDFWSTGCAACIAGMPKFELIQNRFDQDAIVIFVNSKRNKDTPEKIKARFKKYKADHNYSPSLPTLLDDTIFTALFEHNSIPRSAIINKRGEFIGTSYSDNLSDRNISKMIKDGTLPFQSMGNIINNKFENIPLLADTAGFDYMSVLSGFRVNYNPIYPNVHYINGQTLYQVGNYALRLMYQHAFLDEIKDSESKNYVFDPSVDEMSIKKLFDLQNQKYWYQYFSKDSVDEQVVHEHFRKSLIDNFHFDVVRKNEEIGVYNLKIDRHDNALLTKGGMPIFWVYEGNRNLVIQNTNLNGIANFLRPYLDQPIIIEDPYGQHVDLILPGNFIDLTVSERIALLKSKGIILNYEKRKMEFPYFYLSAK
ncbi:TlpA family protein disulfide reductase [Sphingobacterium sp. PCS056]|uniref:TlpA family protein disulfide reductase n=1 Tax=Sphingobacterium sp. PCS056 TaxID=2931400 RepID=UPI00201064AC|nr:TlpA disulfide reductase family protein [Sphingobacterium sp. PCS056]UPZ37479.1 TlpA family protein disulfide reductase [Sphingobacterium sp. PCS056]